MFTIAIINYLLKNVANAKAILKLAIPAVAKLKNFSASNALQYAIITDRKLITPKLKKDLAPIIGKYM